MTSERTLLSLLASFELLILAMAYSRVSVNNGQARSIGSSSIQDVAFTVSPDVYVVTPRTIELRPGEAINHPSTPTSYSTLDEEQVAQLDAIESRQRAQDRFVPHSGIDAHAHSLRQQALLQKQQSSFASSPTNSDVVYTKPLVSMTFDYPSGPTSYEGKPGKPVNDLPLYPPLKPLDSYNAPNPINDVSPPQAPAPAPSPPPPTNHIHEAPTYNYGTPPNSNHIHDIPTFNFDSPPKSIEYSSHYDPPFQHVPSYAGPYPHDDIIYDEDHDDFHHHHHYHHPKPTTTQEPEMMDQRVNDHYSHYYIGKKLWYVPLYFSIYFIIYISALVLRSIARHKIKFPENLAAVAAGANNARAEEGPGWRDYVVNVLDAVEKYGAVFKD